MGIIYNIVGYWLGGFHLKERHNVDLKTPIRFHSEFDKNSACINEDHSDSYIQNGASSCATMHVNEPNGVKTQPVEPTAQRPTALYKDTSSEAAVGPSQVKANSMLKNLFNKENPRDSPDNAQK